MMYVKVASIHAGRIRGTDLGSQAPPRRSEHEKGSNNGMKNEQPNVATAHRSRCPELEIESAAHEKSVQSSESNLVGSGSQRGILDRDNGDISRTVALFGGERYSRPAHDDGRRPDPSRGNEREHVKGVVA